MKTIISVGSAIRTILSGNKDLMKRVKNQLYPIIAPEGTTFPFITYRRNSNEMGTKDGQFDNGVVSILIASDKYEDGVEIAETVKDTLVAKNQNINGILINYIKLNSTVEDYNPEANGYMQELSFSVRVQN